MKFVYTCAVDCLASSRDREAAGMDQVVTQPAATVRCKEHGQVGYGAAPPQIRQVAAKHLQHTCTHPLSFAALQASQVSSPAPVDLEALAMHKQT